MRTLFFICFWVLLSLGFTLGQTDFGIAQSACSDKLGATQIDQLLLENSSELPSIWLCPRGSGGG